MPRFFLTIVVISSSLLFLLVSSAQPATVAYWRFEGTVGNNFISDTSTVGGYVANAAVGNAGSSSPSLKYGPSPNNTFGGNSALDLRGNPPYNPVDQGQNNLGRCLQVNSNSNLDGFGAMTIEAWINPETVKYAMIVRKHANSSDATPDVNDGYWLNTTPQGQVNFMMGTDYEHFCNLSTDTGIITANHWYHVAGTWDGSTARIYINGTQVSSVPFSGALNHTAGNLGIGAIIRNNNLAATGDTSGYYFDGLMDEVRISNVALAPNQFLLPTLAGPTWNLDRSGDWDNAANWRSGIPNGKDAIAIFGDSTTVPRLAFCSSQVTLGTLMFDHTQSYTVTDAYPNGGLTMEASETATIQVLQGSHKINLPLTFNSNTTINVAAYSTLKISDPINVNGKTVTKSGGGSLDLEGPLTGGTIVVQAGTLEISDGIAPASSFLLDVQSGTAVLNTTNVNNVNANITTGVSGTFEIGNGTHVIGSIIGNGTTIVSSGSSLTANSIVQSTLIIGSGNSISIRETTDEVAMTVPEPATLSLLGIGMVSFAAIAWRRKSYSR